MDSQTTPSYEDIIHKDILDLMGAGDLSPDHKNKLYQQMAQTIQSRVALHIMDKLSKADREEFRQIVEYGHREQFNEFLAKRHFDVPRLLLEEAVRYKVELVELGQNLPTNN